MSETAATNLYTALLAAQRTMGPVKKDASNPAFRTKYATLQSVLETVEGPLSENGLVLLQRFDAGTSGPVLITEIVHAATGDRVSSTMAVIGKDMTDPQKVGGAITYARRYSLLALLGLAPEDDDGHSASQPPPPRQQRQAPAQQAPAPAPATLTEAQDTVIAQAWEMAESKDTFEAVAAHLKTLKQAASEGQWAEINRIGQAIRQKHYPATLAPKRPASFSG